MHHEVLVDRHAQLQEQARAGRHVQVQHKALVGRHVQVQHKRPCRYSTVAAQAAVGHKPLGTAQASFEQIRPGEAAADHTPPGTVQQTAVEQRHRYVHRLL